MSSIRRPHPAWIVLAAVTLCMMAGTGLRPPSASTSSLHGGGVRLGSGCPVGCCRDLASASGRGRALRRPRCRPLGARRVVVFSLVLLGVEPLGASRAQSLSQIYLTIGLLMAVGAGGLDGHRSDGGGAMVRAAPRRRHRPGCRRNVGRAARGDSRGDGAHTVVRLALELPLARRRAAPAGAPDRAPPRSQRPGRARASPLRRHRDRERSGRGGGDREVAARNDPGGDAGAPVLAPDGDLLRVRLHLEWHGAHPLHAARARAQLQRAAGRRWRSP